MERLSDEDFIPPTPQLPRQQKIVRQNSKDQIKSTNKNSKTPTSKRKKESGVSPDFKKIKNKSKQVTLLNFIRKGNPTNDDKKKNGESAKAKLFVDNCSNNTSVSSNIKYKKPIFNSEVGDAKKEQFETDLVELEKNSSKINLAKLNHSSQRKEPQHGCIHEFMPIDDANEHFIIPKSLNTKPDEANDVKCYGNNGVKETVTNTSICTKINNLSLEMDKNVKGNEPCLTKPQSENSIPDISLKENTYELGSQSLSWLNEVDWKDCNDFAECDSKMFDITIEDEDKKSSKTLIPYKVSSLQRTAANELKLILTKHNSKSQKEKICLLRGYWQETLVKAGDIIYVLKEFYEGEAIIDNDSGFVIVNPDFLLSSTAVVSTLFCMRKAALNHILPQWSSGNNFMMIGTLVHDVFQQAVNSSAKSVKEVEIILANVLQRRDYIIALSCQETPEAEILSKAKEYVPSIYNWIRKHCAFGGKNCSANIQITSIEAIEDNLWCPKYGIKGKIDMTVQTCCKKKTEVMPLELKTGRASYSAEHIGQVNLYSLMMEERAYEMADGLLLYLKDIGNMKRVSANHHSLRGLIQLRNELAHYTHKWMSKCGTEDIEDCLLPKPLDNRRLCSKCPYVLPCTVYQRALSEDKALKPDHAMISLISTSTAHLKEDHFKYFIHWSNLLLLESTSSAVSNAFWTEEALEREKKGLCLSNLCLISPSIKTDSRDSPSFLLTFQRSSDDAFFSLSRVGLKDGDYVAVSGQGSLEAVAIAMGYVAGVSETTVQVIVERDLTSIEKYKSTIFRIDKQISNSANACIRNNLVRLMEDNDRASRLRDFVIDRRQPAFLTSLPKNVVLQGKSILKPLNKIQQRTVLKALMAEDYFVIKGMPGTGKTSTIVALVRLLLTMGASVFLTSYTHSAIDNILLKLKEHATFVRVGQEARIHPALKQYSFESRTRDCDTVEKFRCFMNEQMVVAATCLSMNHAVFRVRSFDVCIVDEASQINQIACIGPLFHAKKFILVGDEKQLPPLVVNEKARSKGMQNSLLERLVNKNNSMDLTIQYRMNKEIMRFCNTLTYNGALQCGSDEVSERTLNISTSSEVKTPWLRSLFEPCLDKSVMFLDTDRSARDVEKSEGRESNQYEANIVIEILQFLVSSEIGEHQIGVITPYRKQVDLLQTELKCLNLEKIEVNTVDQYQGRDKDIILISCVKSVCTVSSTEQKGMIMNDERRLNVAITRAKCKLIFIGSKEALQQFSPFQKFIQLLRCDQIVNV